MIGFLKNSVRHFLRDDDGSMVVPFALWTPLFIGLMVSSIEMGTLTIRHSALERAMDQTVRELRLGTGTHYSHAELKDMICVKAGVLPNCAGMLHLEMIKMDMRAFNEPDYLPDCVDLAEEATPQRNFQYGASNEVMFLRACYKYDPFSPAGYLGGSMMADDEGNVALIATSAFVQEPS